MQVQSQSQLQLQWPYLRPLQRHLRHLRPLFEPRTDGSGGVRLSH